MSEGKSAGYEKRQQEQVGSIGYTVEADTPVGKLVHLGYFTYPRHWGNGYTSEALKKVLEYAFTQDNVYRVTTGCLSAPCDRNRISAPGISCQTGLPRNPVWLPQRDATVCPADSTWSRHPFSICCMPQNPSLYNLLK